MGRFINVYNNEKRVYDNKAKFIVKMSERIQMVSYNNFNGYYIYLFY